MSDFNFNNVIPPNDSKHWNPMVANILKNTVHAPRITDNVWTHIFRLAIPAIAAATIITVGAWALAFSFERNVSTNSITQSEWDESENTLLTWATQPGAPSTADIYHLLGGNDDSTKP